MMKRNILWVFVVVLVSVILTACEKANWDDGGQKPVQGDEVRVVFNVKRFEQIPFNDGIDVTKANVSVDNICTHIHLAVFNNGGKVKTISQKAGDEHFGTITADLPKGTYKIVLIAHSCKGTATITSPEKISFPDNKLTDTFYYCSNVTVGNDTEYNIELKRAVSMFRLITEDAIPERVAAIRFYYTGGSSSLNAVTGFGCVKSRQTEIRTIDATSVNKSGKFEIYTFPHEEADKLKITVTALDAAGNTIKEQIFSKVPVKRNVITQYTGRFFDGSGASSSSSSFVLTANDVWAQNDFRY